MALLCKLANNSDESDDNEINDIIRNLNNLLMTKQGYGFFVRDFGLSDYHHLSTGDKITALIMEDIQKAIEHFEPRLEVIDITPIQGGDFERLSFALNCKVCSTHLALNLFVDPVRGCYKVDTR